MKTILVIEDEPEIRRNINTLLELEGYRVVVAGNGARGIEAARRSRPDLILCDVTMPDLDGFGVIQVIRSIPALSAVPFIFLSGRSHASDVRAGMNLGADDYLPKPFTAPDLLAAIKSRLNRIQSLQDTAEKRRPSAADPNPPDFDSPGPLIGLGLTPSEANVLLWIAHGKSNGDIAIILGCAVATIKKHAQRIFDKLGVDNRVGAMIVARETLARRT